MSFRGHESCRPTSGALALLMLLAAAPALAQPSALSGRGAKQISGPWVTAAADITSREQLFDAPDEEVKKSKGISGFYDLDLAYTYGEPGHWSRGVSRLQFGTEGGLTPRVKYKLGARIDADPVYAWSDFYPRDVKRDQRLDAVWRENYVDFSAGNIDFRIGAQQIVWGEVVGLFFADVVSARDQREFLLPSFDIIRIPQWAARAEYFAGDAHVELVWIPVPAFDRIGKPAGEFYPIVFHDRQADSAPVTILDIDRPARNLENGNFGVRGNTLLAGWDVAAFYYRSFSTQPTFYRVGAGNDGTPVLQPRYDRIGQLGATVTKDFQSFVMRGEAVYTRGQRLSSLDPSANEGVVERNTLDYIASIEFPFANDARLNVQVFQRAYAGGRHDLALNTGDFGASVLFSWKPFAKLEPQLQWIQTFGGGGGLARPRVTWMAEKNLSVAFGADVFTGPADGLFGRYNNRDRVYSELRYDF